MNSKDQSGWSHLFLHLQWLLACVSICVWMNNLKCRTDLSSQEVTELVSFLLQKDVSATKLYFGSSHKGNAAASGRLGTKKSQVAANYTARTLGRADYKRQYRPAPSPHFILCIFVLSPVTYPHLACMLSLFSHMFTFNKFSWTNESSNGNFQPKSSIQMDVLIFSYVIPFLHLCIFFSLSLNVILMFNYACSIA